MRSPTTPKHWREAAAALLAASTLTLAACGSTGTASTTVTANASASGELGTDTPAASQDSPTNESAPASSEIQEPILPVVVVDEVGTGAQVELASILPAEQPVLVWFYAPH